MESLPNELGRYGGTFGREQARHLLRRATVGGATHANVELAVELGLTATVDRLLAPRAISKPITWIDDHPTLALGETWVYTPGVKGFNENWRRRSLHSWVVDTYLSAGMSVHARMWHFWINHFGVDTTNPAHLGYYYYAKLDEHVTGNFKSLISDITIEAKMLTFLNGNQNNARAPNENYARELLELFTVGKGEQRGEGDYTNYTETDVRELARALTGWKVANRYNDPDGTKPTSYFDAGKHDTGDKQLSAAFGGAVIADGGDREYLAVVDAVLAQPRSLDYLCRKLYRWFVDYRVTADTEANVIRPLADALKAANFNVRAILRLLLQSERFFAPEHRGALAKSPLDYVADVCIGFGSALPPRREVKRRNGLANVLKGQLGRQGMDVETPDSVAGYKPFHQEPHFNRYWINPTSLRNRASLVDALVSRKGLGLGGGVEPAFKPDLLGYVDTFENPSNPNDLLAELAERHLPRPVPYSQIGVLKEYLIPNLPDWEWTVEYELYKSSPNDEGQRSAVAERVETVWRALCGSAEFTLY